MKKLALALCLVLAFSSVAVAAPDAKLSTTVVVAHVNYYKDGSPNHQYTNNNSISAIMDASGNKWKGRAEMGSVKDLNLGKWYLTISEPAYTLSFWGNNHDIGADKTTPFGWVKQLKNVASISQMRLSSELYGVQYVVASNNQANPVYYLFAEKKVDVATVGGAYSVTLNGQGDNGIFSVWAKAKIGNIDTQAEFARIEVADKFTNNKGAKVTVADIGFGIKAIATFKTEDKKMTLDGELDRSLARLKTTFVDDVANKKKTLTYDVIVRGSNDQGWADVFAFSSLTNAWTDGKYAQGDHIWNLNASGNARWTRNKTWAVGAVLQTVKEEGKDDKNTLTLNAMAKVTDQIKVLGKVTTETQGNTTTQAFEVHGQYAAGSLFVNPLFKKNANTSSKVGSYVFYNLTKGTLLGGYWLDKADDDKNTKAVQTIITGYRIAF